MESYCGSESACSTCSSRSGDNSHLRLIPPYRPGKRRGHQDRRRVILKNGQTNMVTRNMVDRRMRLLQSLFTTLVDMQWRWILLLVTLCFFATWLSFALIWWLIALVHGDLEVEHLPLEQEGIGWTPCVTGMEGFTSAFLFSMENQHTTGFGTRVPTEECPEAIFIMCIQAIFGVIIQTALVGVVLAKLSRPKQRQNTLLFSRNAIVCQRDGVLCLMLRIGDVQKSHIIDANLRLQFVVTNSMIEDEVLSPFRRELKVNIALKNFVLMWPEMVVHKIDKDSPLFELSAEEMLYAKFEIVAILDGTLESTDQRVQAMTSFLPNDILWGHRFHPVITYNSELKSYQVDYKMFDAVYPVDTPMCSAKNLASFQEEFIHRSKQDMLESGTHETAMNVNEPNIDSGVPYDSMV